MTWSIQFENVTKRYGREGKRYASLRDDLASLGRRASRLFGRRVEEPLGFLALDRLSFEVTEGEAFALIGPNGAGKTTSLKLLTRISFPTQGRIRVRGRVAALIEVGSGIHPELTGRENIWLYGRIMGMTRQQIARRFDAIVDFAELGHVLDTPTKMYSSGMQLRLGFSIASHLDPDVFVVDEALAVGDQAFQTRCVERMMQLIREGRTLLFVSHNLSAVEAICPRGLFLLDGRIEAIGKTSDVLRRYLDWVETRQYDRLVQEAEAAEPGGELRIDRVSFCDAGGVERHAFHTGEDIEVRLVVSTDRPVRRPIFSVAISDGRAGSLILCSMLIDGHVPEVIDGTMVVTCRIRRIPLLPRLYQLWCGVRNSHGHGDLVHAQVVGAFRVVAGSEPYEGIAPVTHLREAPIHADYEWGWSAPTSADARPAVGSGNGQGDRA